jgi:hypothetical protein
MSTASSFFPSDTKVHPRIASAETFAGYQRIKGFVDIKRIPIKLFCLWLMSQFVLDSSEIHIVRDIRVPHQL